MRLLAYMVVVSMFYCAFCKSNVQALTESNGQEIIKIGPGIKEFPPELEEEPSAENDDDEVKTGGPAVTASTVQIATKKDAKKTQETSERNAAKEAELADEEDRRIEKELEETYKDVPNNDYDALRTDKASNKSAPRPKTNFKFQPDLDNPEEIEKFRTSVDDIFCSKGVTKLDATVYNLNRDIFNEEDHAPTGASGIFDANFIMLLKLILVFIVFG